MNFLRQRLGRPLLSEFSELLLKYFRGTNRKPNESVNDYVTRKCEALCESTAVATASDEGSQRRGDGTEPRECGHLAHWRGTLGAAVRAEGPAGTLPTPVLVWMGLRRTRRTVRPPVRRRPPTASTADDGAGDNPAQEESWWRPSHLVAGEATTAHSREHRGTGILRGILSRHGPHGVWRRRKSPPLPS